MCRRERILEKKVDCLLEFFFFKQKTAYESLSGLVGSEMCISDKNRTVGALLP